MCSYFEISLQAFYKSQKQEQREEFEESIVIDMVLQVRRDLPRLGGKKLYH